MSTQGIGLSSCWKTMKRDTGSQNAEGRAVKRRKTSKDDEDAITLPTEIFGLITEHLVGAHAFGTAADLNLVSKAVHAETSPVLWESVVFDGLSSYAWNCDHPPVNLKYTKFVFIRNTSLDKDLQAAMPKLIMLVAIGRMVHNNDYCYLDIHRPTSTTTLLVILQTPLQHSPRSFMHMRCMQYFGGGSGDRDDTLLPGCAAVQQQSARIDRLPDYRPVGVISGVKLYDDGYIYGTPSAPRPEITVDSLLENTFIQHHGAKKAERKHHIDTAIQLLVVSAAQANPSHLADKERIALEARQFNCMYAPPYTTWHLNLSLTEAEADKFITKLRDQARLAPLILQSRLCIGMRGKVDPQYPLSIVERLREIFEENVTAPGQLLPFDPARPPSLVSVCKSDDTSGPQDAHLIVSVAEGRVVFKCK